MLMLQKNVKILFLKNNIIMYGTVNIFCFKSGHLSNRIIERFFFIFSKLFAVFDDFSKWRVRNVLQNSEKSSNIANIAGK